MSRLASYTKGYIDVRTINTQITILHFNSIPSQIKTKKKRETFLFCGLINAKTNKKETEKIKSKDKNERRWFNLKKEVFINSPTLQC